jgi:hypothetical protein
LKNAAVTGTGTRKGTVELALVGKYRVLFRDSSVGRANDC